MICFEEVKGKGCFRAIEGRRVPTHAEELSVVLMGNVARAALAEPYL